MTHPKLAPWPDGTQRQTSPTSRPTSHNASNGRPQSTLVDVIDTPKATSHKATEESCRSGPVGAGVHDRLRPKGGVQCRGRSTPDQRPEVLFSVNASSRMPRHGNARSLRAGLGAEQRQEPRPAGVTFVRTALA